MTIDDVQQRLDTRNLPIQRAGVKALSFPVTFEDKGRRQNTVGTFDLAVGLPADRKGTHLSRFVELLQDYHNKNSLVLSPTSLHLWHRRMILLLNAESGFFSCQAPYFLETKAPVSQKTSLLETQLLFFCQGPLDAPELSFQLKIPVTSLCPCSKEISDYGAHNQRSILSIKASFTENFSVAEVADLLAEQSSCPIYPILKRSDEKYVTERAYNHPKFCEDMVRDTYLAIKAHYPLFKNVMIESEHLESIHAHNAYACLHD